MALESLENYSVCLLCDTFIENLSEGWIGHVPCVTEDGKHIPTIAEEYRSHKFGNDIHAEVMYRLGLEGSETDSFGESDGYGYFELYEDAAAYIVVNSQGFVDGHYFDSPKEARDAFETEKEGYWDYLNDPEPEEEYDDYGRMDYDEWA